MAVGQSGEPLVAISLPQECLVGSTISPANGLANPKAHEPCFARTKGHVRCRLLQHLEGDGQKTSKAPSRNGSQYLPGRPPPQTRTHVTIRTRTQVLFTSRHFDYMGMTSAWSFLFFFVHTKVSWRTLLTVWHLRQPLGMFFFFSSGSTSSKSVM